MERRSFSEYEKKTIEIIVNKAGDSVDYLLVNVYNDIFYYTNVEYINNELHFYYKESEFNKIDSNSTLEVKKDVIVKTLLLQYLVENRYIYLVEHRNVTNLNNNIRLGNINDTKYDVKVELPNDIVEFLNTTKRVVIVSEELKTLVRDNFVTPEEKLLKETKDQAENIKTQIFQIAALHGATLKLVKAAEKQTKESLRQTKEAQKQTNEAQKQTEEAQKQTTQALEQTSNAKKQTDHALKQTEQALKQTKLSKWVLGFSVLSLVCSITTVLIAKYQNKITNELNKQEYQYKITSDSTKLEIIQGIENNAFEIKSKADTIITNQNNNKFLLERMNSQLKNATKKP